MREALAARPDRDFVVSAPARRPAAGARRAAPSRRTPSKKKRLGVAARMVSSLARNPFRVLVTLVLSGCAFMIVWNALVLQQARHPAPLFDHPGLAPQAVMPAPPARGVAAPPLASSVPPAATPSLIDPAPTATTPPPVPPSRSAITDLIRTNGESAPQAPRQASVPAPVPKPAAVRDPIADMIRMGGAVPIPPANVGTDNADPVLAAQRALAKLGYGVKPDGIMGGETRAAIERFEHDRKLPVTGEFNARTVRELSIASGMVISQ